MDTLQLRTGILAKVVNGTKVLTKKRLEIEISDAIPFIVTDDSIVTNTKIAENITTPVLDLNTLPNQLVDDNATVLTERYIYVTNIISPVTKNTMSIYYDKTFKDLIVIPSLNILDSSDIVTGAINFKVKGYALGVHYNPEYENEIEHYPYTPETNFQLPISNGNIGVTTTAVLINGAGGYLKDDSVGKYITGIDSNSYVPSKTSYTNFINLGQVSAFLSAVTKIPVYLLYQTSKHKHGVAHLGITDTKTSNIYFELKF